VGRFRTSGDAFKTKRDRQRPGCRHRGLLPTLDDSHGAAVDACFVDEERVDPQQGDFYGGDHLACGRPFEGGPRNQTVVASPILRQFD
jgi:hypothetical protein